MKTAIKNLILIFALAVFIFPITSFGAGGDWTQELSFACAGPDIAGNGTWTLDTGHGNIYHDIYQGVPGNATILNGHLSSSNPFTDSSGDCDVVDPNESWFVTVEEGASVTAFRAYFENGGSAPNQNYGLLFFPALQGNTRVTQINSPGDGVTTSSTNVFFSFDIFYNSGGPSFYDHVGIELIDVTSGQEMNTATSSINASGNSSYGFYMSLPADHFMTWRPYIADNVGSSTRIYGSVRTFVVNDNSSFIQLPTNENEATSSLPSILSNALNIPQLIRNKFPFNWAFAVIDGVQAFNNNASTTAIASTTISLGNMSSYGGYGTSTLHYSFDIFGPGYIEKIKNLPNWELLRTLIAGLLIIELMWFAFHEAMVIFNKH